MRRISELGYLMIVAIAVFATGCQKSPTESTPPASVAETSTQDPAAGNLAPVTQTAAQQPTQTSQQAAIPADQANYQNDNAYAGSDDVDSEEQPVYASEPPPPLPEYNQPECPGENYLWTPGYWSYAPAGYYWVPGAWVLAPYVGALWTPPYWGFEAGRYRLHHGYWAPHIGFYGGINYGFGYVGRGYYGGYWRNRTFNYNRSVTHVNVAVVHNVYNYNVEVNNRTVINNTRISYNGGNGGVRLQPIPAEQAVLRERRVAPVAVQVQHTREAASNRAQFVQANRGRPAELAAARPLPTAYHAPAAAPPPRQPREAIPNRSNSPNVAARPEARPAPESTAGSCATRGTAGSCAAGGTVRSRASRGKASSRPSAARSSRTSPESAYAATQSGTAACSTAESRIAAGTAAQSENRSREWNRILRHSPEWNRILRPRRSRNRRWSHALHRSREQSRARRKGGLIQKQTSHPWSINLQRLT